MKISEKQIYALLIIAQRAAQYHANAGDINSENQVCNLIREIRGQQSDELREVE